MQPCVPNRQRRAEMREHDRRAIPGGDNTARATDNGHESQDVIGLKASIHHDIVQAACEHAIGIAIAIFDHCAASIRQRDKGAGLCGSEIAAAGGGDARRGQGRAGAGVRRHVEGAEAHQARVCDEGLSNPTSVTLPQ